MSELETRPDAEEVIDEPPPFLGSWGRVHVVVIAYLAGLILVFSLFAHIFTP